jgi:inward rectifier potassium channel
MRSKLKNRHLIVRRLGVEESPFEDLYHRLLRLSWPRFLGITFAFAFGAQALTVYGNFFPHTSLGNLVLTLEAAFEMFAAALLTGLVFAKFARPTARVVFSDNILWTTSNGRPVVSLRLGNIRANRIFEGRAKLTLLRDETTEEGEKIRKLVDLKLAREATPLFSLSWTIYHFIDQESPLQGMTPEEMKRLGWEIFVTFIGFDQDISQDIVAHSTYSAEHIQRARKFADMIEVSDGIRVIDFSKLNQTEL